jgi:spore coat polysaccharide biosynthesis protein SpsF
MAKSTVMIQTRIGSSRLPNKVLELIENQAMISHVINRVKKIKNIDQIILITTTQSEDKQLLNIAKEHDIQYFQGSVDDVLDRHFQCAVIFNADPIIRITSDCPLIDPEVSSKILEYYLQNNYDYVSNTITPTYPDGLDTEIFSFKALSKAHIESNLPSEREHVTTYFTKNPKKFRIKNFPNTVDLSKFRWTVDRTQDLDFVRRIYNYMAPKTIFSMNDVLDIIKKYHELSKINDQIMRNEGHLKSLKKDKDAS